MCKEFFDTFKNVQNKKVINEIKINKIFRDLFLFKNKFQKLLTSINLKQYLKHLVKRT
jgi:hypothetical protein